MPSLDEISSDETFVKLLYCGESGAGKTGSLTSLVKAGYKINLIDLDNGFGVLRQYVRKECLDKISNVRVVSYRDKYKPTPQGSVVSGAPKAFVRTMEALDKWPDDDSNPAEWGPEHVLVLDSLTALGRAAYVLNEKMNPAIKHKQQIFQMAQNDIMSVLYNLTADEFRTNVIVCTHIRYNDEETKGWATSVGKALGPQLPSLFNNFVQAYTKGRGDNTQRLIRTTTSGVIDLKNEKDFDVDRELPLSSGLATLFSQLKGN